MAGKKIEEKILPPDPARLIEFVLSILPSIEHATPLPPLVERVHRIVRDQVEKLPRLGLMGEFTWKKHLEFP